MPPATLLDRRRLLTGLTLTGAGLRAAHAAEPLPGRVAPGTLLSAGPAGGRLDRWADLLANPIGRALPGRTALILKNVGGLDGVTGANQFEARGEPDGTSSMLVPGLAMLSWLVGETRARFDPARWVSLWAGAGSAVLVSRVVLTPGRTLRVAATGPAGPELPAFLALDLLGIAGTPSPVQGADAMLLRGAGLRLALADAARHGFEPVLTFGMMEANGPVRDPMLPTVQTAFELVRGRAPVALIDALRAAAVAAQLDASLVLPQLTPAASVALWRRACLPLSQDTGLMREAARMDIRPVAADITTLWTRQIAGDPAVLLTLRQWLATRYEWHPA